jgi:hypothetical protein
MSVPARRGREASAADLIPFDFGGEPSLGALDASERIGRPLERRGSSMLSATLVLLVLFGGGWAVLQAPADWLEALGAQVSKLTELARGQGATSAISDPSTIATGELAAAAPMPPIEEQEAKVAADAATPPDAIPVETGTIDTARPAEPQPLPPLRIDPADPYQKRAVAVGLHPDLSRVLLSRLSEADYRNARYAIDTAIAKTADEENFVWPRQRKPEQALFRVHFVQGAAPECRRYVVTVVKDGWSTTALPMERCGSELRGRKGSGAERASVSAR